MYSQATITMYWLWNLIITSITDMDSALSNSKWWISITLAGNQQHLENHLAMKSLVQLFNEWEIQILVLLSFTIQFFLFFAGGRRLRITEGALTLLIWLAYLGADLVAAYVLGLISRLGHTTPGTHQLALLWAPFLLIHLGGQDTITAFSIEDNKLWKRHLLNLAVQVSLTLYIFGKSTNDPNKQLLIPSILLFATGTIKYGERIWALWSGSLRKIARAPVPLYTENVLAARIRPVLPEFELAESINIQSSYTDIASSALQAMHLVHLVFFCESTQIGIVFWNGLFRPEISAKLFEIMTIELHLMLDDIYTKALVLRTRSGIILRCLSDISFLVAFVLFSVTKRDTTPLTLQSPTDYSLVVSFLKFARYSPP